MSSQGSSLEQSLEQSFDSATTTDSKVDGTETVASIDSANKALDDNRLAYQLNMKPQNDENDSCPDKQNGSNPTESEPTENGHEWKPDRNDLHKSLPQDSTDVSEHKESKKRGISPEVPAPDGRTVEVPAQDGRTVEVTATDERTVEVPAPDGRTMEVPATDGRTTRKRGRTLTKQQAVTESESKHGLSNLRQPVNELDLSKPTWADGTNLMASVNSMERQGSVFPCDQCDKAYKSKHSLRDHKLKHAGIRPFSCSECGNTFDRKFTLKLHMMSHMSERPFKCSNALCDKSYTTASALKYHELRHEGKRNYVCDLCDCRFYQQGHLNAHMSTHISDSGEAVVKKKRRGRVSKQDGVE